MSTPVVLTGLRANSEFHIGNYLGGILPVIELQARHAGEYQVNMFVPDLHSFTTPIDHSKLYQQTIDNLKVFVAAGLDINNPNTFIYRQSYVSAHSELQWILSNFTGFGELSRMTQFKDKRDSLAHFANNLAIENDYKGDFPPVTAGLFNYPVLMAADILLYDAKFIPVGDDQKQHIELARDLAMRLNNKFETELFTPPEAWNKQLEFMNLEAGARVRSLRNPEKKMSKSVSDPSGTIMLSDNPAEAAKKVMRAETDSFGEIRYDFKERPGISNLLQMLALLSGRPQAEVSAEWEGKSSYGDLKKAVAAAVEAFLIDIQAKIAGVDENELLAKLEQDEAVMNEVANSKLLKVQKAVGLRR
ncbi:MAG: Tryptophan--tRNA ligase [Candidatus Saccharibacteria bacterium]|nr:Tryptophan--tRNA ligase [Candidatus Saccharibacteria bacterium]